MMDALDLLTVLCGVLALGAAVALSQACSRVLRAARQLEARTLGDGGIGKAILRNHGFSGSVILNASFGRPATSASTTSPGARAPTPSGVPVMMTSPGSSR